MKWFIDIGAHTYDLWAYRHEPEYLRKLVDAYWFVLLVLSAGIIVFALLFGALKLFTVLNEEEGTTLLSSGGNVPFNRAELEMTLEGFAAREANYESLKKNPPRVTDPSK